MFSHPNPKHTIMINKFMSRIRVTTGAVKKKVEFERILSPQNAELLDYNIIVQGLRQIFADDATISIDVYGV